MRVRRGGWMRVRRGGWMRVRRGRLDEDSSIVAV